MFASIGGATETMLGGEDGGDVLAVAQELIDQMLAIRQEGGMVAKEGHTLTCYKGVVEVGKGITGDDSWGGGHSDCVLGGAVVTLGAGLTTGADQQGEGEKGKIVYFHHTRYLVSKIVQKNGDCNSRGEFI